ncbi:synaptotagmin-like protein 2 isoform X3 [Centroberyx affinis]|uniref:synaptotagmin-like protein 2 isoform X3 n=1 Tax=Centroberyx affinis TaxID=166261 RepID=UPI003A5C0339
MIDLSFLTEEEQETIRAVLNRDAELKKAEEKRVKSLQMSVSDKGQLKYLTGEWFYETKSLRHQDRIHGSDIIRASMRHTQKPLTILELSQMLPERPSFVSSENQEVFIPPELSGLIQEPVRRLSNERDQNWNPVETPQEAPKPVLQSPTKRRQNPFNSEPLAPHSFEEEDSQLLDGPVEQTQTPGGEPLSSSDSCISYATNLTQDHPKDSPVTQNAPVPMPVAKKRTSINKSQDSLIEVDESAGRQTNSAAPRGILKHMSSSSSADSLYSCLSLQSPVSLDSPSESIAAREARDREALGWIDRKQVRFCSAIGRSGVEWQDGKELGEHSVLDVDSIAPYEEENYTDLVNAGYTAAGKRKPLLKQREVDLDEGDLSCERGENLQNHDAGQHQVPGDLCEHCHTELLNPQVSNLVSAEQESGKPVPLETGPEEDCHSQAKATDWLTGHTIHQPQPKLPEQSSDKLGIFVEATSDTKPSGNDDDSSPIRSALKRTSSRPMSSSKSLENITSYTAREERSKSIPGGQLNLSVDDVSALPPSASSLSDSEQMKKMSVSVPVFQQEEMDSDSASENNMGWRRNTGSSTSNISISSGMASMSSVSGSVTSIYHADFGDIDVQGTIQFAVNYVQKLGEFHIFVVHCRNLAVAEPKKNRSDPYVKCYLLPDRTKLGKRKTSVKKKTLNPTYNEILRFKIIMEVLKTQKLNISVWHHDTFGRNSFLGEVDLDLSEWNFSNTQIHDYALKARVPALISTASPSHSIDKRGQMRVALRFLPQISHSKRTSKMETGEVQIWVKDCKNLPPVRGVIIDPFVKCTVLPDTSRKSRQKTRVVKRTANPMFNHTMVYDGFRPEDLREACVEITVWDHDRLNNHYIGGLRLGLGTGKSYGAEVAWMDSTTDEANLWERMMQSQGEWVEDVLPLRMLVMAKSVSK